MRRSVRQSLTVLAAASALALTGLPARAETPKVIASIKPIHSLVAGVMQGVGQPRLLVEGGQSPHTYSLTPQEAQALETADLVVWVGPALEAFLERPVGNISDAAAAFRLLRVDGLTLHRNRTGGTWAGHEHGHGHGDGHGEQEQEHDPAAEHGHGHDTAGQTPTDERRIDPHVWLDPANAQAMTTAIAERLAARDPAHAATYRANAAEMRRRIAAADRRVAEIVGPVTDIPYVVFHDAYQYFEKAYGLRAVGSIKLSADRQVGAARLLEIRQKIKDLNARCVFREPQFAPDLVQTAVENTPAAVGTLDPLGVDHPAGPAAYPNMMIDLAENLKTCLGQSG